MPITQFAKHVCHDFRSQLFICACKVKPLAGDDQAGKKSLVRVLCDEIKNQFRQRVRIVHVSHFDNLEQIVQLVRHTTPTNNNVTVR